MHFKKIIIPLVLVFFSSCYTTCVQPLNCPKANDPKVITTISYFWGLKEDKRLKNTQCTDCGGNGFARVTVVNNFGYILCSVFTLGMVVPTQIWYDCSTPAQTAQPTTLSPHPAGLPTTASPQTEVVPCGKPTARQSAKDPCR